MSELTRLCVEHVDLVIITSGHPQLFAVGRDVAHVRTATAGNGPVGDDTISLGIEHGDGAGAVTPGLQSVPAAIGDVEQLAVAAREDSVRADAGLDEIDPLELVGIDDEDTVQFHVRYIELGAVRG